MIDTLIENIKKKINLSLDETEQLFDKIFNGEVIQVPLLASWML